MAIEIPTIWDRWRTKWWKISLAISLITLLAILVLTVDERTISSLTAISPQYLLLALTMHVIAWFAWGMRIKVMTRITENEISFVEAFKVVLGNLFMACITPSQAGGEPVRIGMLNQKGISIGDATAIVLGERCLDALVLGIAAPVSLFIFRHILKDYIAISTVFVCAGILFTLTFGIAVYGVVKPEAIKRQIKRFIKHEGRADLAITEIDNFRSSILRFVSTDGGRRALLLGLIFTTLFWTIEFSVPSFILMGMGQDPIWVTSMAAQVLITVIIMVPTTPGSSGVAEVSITSLFAVGVQKSVLGVFVLTFRFLTYYVNLIVGGLYNLKMLKESGK